MSANVRCTNVNAWKDGAPRICGWTGKRATSVSAPVTFTWSSGRKTVDRGRRLPTDPTAKPCPKCGGRVELIPRSTP